MLLVFELSLRFIDDAADILSLFVISLLIYASLCEILYKASMLWVMALLCAGLGRPSSAQLLQQIPSVQVKISDLPFAVGNAQSMSQIVWTVLGTTSQEPIYCVSEAPVSQLRFVCLDCLQRNITDMVQVLNSAQDLTRDAGFPTVTLRNIAVNTNWTGATIVCQANVNGQTVDSAPATVDVRYMKQPHVVDNDGEGPVLIDNKGYSFYVECQRGADGSCQSTSRRKTLKCSVDAHPAPTTYRWLKNGVVTRFDQNQLFNKMLSGNGAEITIGTEMIGQSIQCSANNGLFTPGASPSSEAVLINPYSAARVIQDNFQNLLSSNSFAGGRIQLDQSISLGCQVEGNPRPIVFWRLRKPNGQIVDAACPQGIEGQYQEVAIPDGIASSNVRLNAMCSLRVSNYSFAGQYWCSACSFVSQGGPECSPPLDGPNTETLTLQVQGRPLQSDTPPSIVQNQNTGMAIVTVHFCSDPAPTPPRDIIFQIDKNDIQPGQSWENFRFEGYSQNSSLPNCYSARLSIDRVSEADQSRNIVLKVQNSRGARERKPELKIPVSLEDLLGGDSVHSGGFPRAWIIFFVLLGLCVLAAAILTVCIRKQLMCFDRTKTLSDDMYSQTKAKNLAPSIDSRFEEPRLFQPSPAEAAPSPSFHEGINYAEMRLTSDLDPPPIPCRPQLNSTV